VRQPEDAKQPLIDEGDDVDDLLAPQRQTPRSRQLRTGRVFRPRCMRSLSGCGCTGDWCIWTAQGDVYGAANLAARVFGLAPPGAVVVSDSTEPLVRDAFELRAR
jgi:hypothetical protein